MVRYEKLCISKRQLERQFLTKAGVSPKQYAWIRRIGYLCNLINWDHASFSRQLGGDQ